MIRKERTDKFSLHTILPLGNFAGEGDAGAGGGAPVKSQEQIGKEIEAAWSGKPAPIVEKKDTSTTPKPGDLNYVAPTLKPGEPGYVAPTVVDFKPSGYWDKVKTDFEKTAGAGTFKMPDGVTAENEHEKFIEFLQSNLEPDTSKLHPFVKEIMDASQSPDFDPDKFLETKVKQKTFLDLPSKDFMKQHLKAIAERDKTGWTDEDIDTHLAGKDKIQLDADANALKAEYKKIQDEQAGEFNKTRTAKMEEEFNTLQTKRTNDITSLIERNKSVNDFYGVKFGEAEIKEFHKWLPDMLTISKETGSYPLMDYLRSDDNLMKIAAIVYKTEKGMRDYLSEVKEGTKSDLMQKLKLTPNVDGGGIIQSEKPKPFSI